MSSSFLTLIFFGCLFQSGLGDNPEEIFHGCMQETQVPPEILHKIIMHDTDFDDQRGKCFERCACFKLGLCDEKDGQFLIEMFVQKKPFLSAEKVRFLYEVEELINENKCFR